MLGLTFIMLVDTYSLVNLHSTLVQDLFHLTLKNMTRYWAICLNCHAGDKFIIIKDKIIQIEEESFEELKDYKFFCFKGKVHFFKIDFGRFVEHHANYSSPDGILLPFGEKSLEPDPNHKEVMLDNLTNMIRVAEELSKEFKFLRVDLYNVKGKIYFGELTIYPAAGMGAFIPEEWDDKLGFLLNLDNLHVH